QPGQVNGNAHACDQEVKVSRFQQPAARRRPPEGAANEPGETRSGRTESDSASGQCKRERCQQAANSQADLVGPGGGPAQQEEQLRGPTAGVEDRRLEIAGLKRRVIASCGSSFVPVAIAEQAVVGVKGVPSVEDRLVVRQSFEGEPGA